MKKKSMLRLGKEKLIMEAETKLQRVEEPPIHLIARNTTEMKAAQESLKQWLLKKLAQIDADVAELEESIAYQKQRKWNYSALTKQKSKALAGRVFYEKIYAAVDAGYTIVPEFPIDVFAIRVNRAEPVQAATSSTYNKPSLDEEQPDVLPQNEGEYVSELPKAYRWDSQVDDGKGGKITRHNASASRFQDVAFPVVIARPEIMDATAQAMALKVFDRIGICPKNPSRKRDPMIIGQVLLKQGWYGSYREVNFLVGWHINLNKL